VNCRESELPGIGRKFEVITKTNDKIVIVIHDDGRREIYHFDADDHEESISSVTFNDSEARQVAAILGGMVYKPKALESIEIALDDLVIEWFKVEPGAPAVNKSILDIDIRNEYGVTVIAIMKKNQKKVLNPGPETLIEAGDTLVISGERKDLKALIKNLLSS
jgi:TrkA domain protein